MYVLCQGIVKQNPSGETVSQSQIYPLYSPPMPAPFSPAEVKRLCAEFESRSPQEILVWAAQTFAPRLALTSSFQTQSLPLLHMLAQIAPQTPVFFLDTGLHFWETLLFREELQRTLGLNVQDLRPESAWQPFLQRFGRELPQEDPDLCCFIRKVQPVQRALQGMEAWVSGIRRDQTPNRQNAQILEREPGGLLKINPLLNWTRAEVQTYIEEHHLPVHPLLQKGYRSIGCRPCTRPVRPGEDERAGRWEGKGKTECGLHTETFKQSGPNAAMMLKSFILTPKEDSPHE
ncbi:MAG: phosphoadenylyl-sulfate reductase [Anaerolineales bacterium]